MRPRHDTLLVWTGAPCSYGCSTCPIDPPTAAPGIQAPELAQRLATIAVDRPRLVVLVGGEPFLRPDLLRLIAVIRAAGCRAGIITTGRPLVYPQLRERLRRAGVAYLRVQLFGAGDGHDRAAAVPGAFEQALAGLRAWVVESGAECDVDVALNVRRRSSAALASEVEAVAREIPAPQVQIVIALAPDAAADPQDAAAVQRAVAALAHWNDDPTRPLLAWEGLPTSIDRATPSLTAPALSPAFIGPAPRACCLGTADQLARAAAAPRDDPHANSFNFVRSDTTVPWTPTADACTAHSAARGADPHRHLWLIEGDRLVLHVTDTADFAPAAIARVKDEWSHLFLDRAPAGVLDDFVQGMRRVLPDPMCNTCPHRSACGRRYAVVDAPPFAREEAWIAAYVAGLRGRVLDVGCGEQLYRNEIGALIRSGVIDYTGLDPDELSVSHIRDALPGGRFLLTGIEEFHGEPASYDHILCLRSLNHVVDLDEALVRMADLLKPGGSLLIVETTPFAMLRRPEQVAAADRAPRAGHQHFRNVTSDEVLPFARRRALQVAAHRPASLENTNEWILLLTRAA